MSTPRYTRGTDLLPVDRQYVLKAYVHRYTGDHIPKWASRGRRSDGSSYPVQFEDDLDWLANTEFAVRKDGQLDRRTKHCLSHPTWPYGSY